MSLGNWHDRPAARQAQVSFATTLAPWLMLKHRDIHIHPTNPKRDHLADPIWIGRALEVHGEVLCEDGRKRWR
ncbi:hypothetical protein O7A70_08555 [Mesorhizobium sp. Cs1299R1N1]|uniref:hypothetical protein n=1 Tax=Mesorhizobium sp. Cs1299R1N1 TaxID=3015172 RepID=UPI00301DD6BD